MIFVLGPTRRAVDEWRQSAGLPTRVVTPITTENQCRGRMLRYNEVVRLAGFDPSPKLAAAIAPCGVDPRKVAVVSGGGA